MANSLITHQGNSQVKESKIDLLVQQYEQFVIPEDESIDSAFARFNTIITSLIALDEGFSSKNNVRKFLRALHPKWRAKVTTIKESKDLTSLSLDELIRNLKVHEMIILKDSEMARSISERKSLALKAKKESSDNECSTSYSEDKEYAMAVRNFKNFFKRRGRYVRQLSNDKKPFPRSRNEKNGKNERNGEEYENNTKEEKCLMAHSSKEVYSETEYYSNDTSSIDDLELNNQYDHLCKLISKIIERNKSLKSTSTRLENEICELKDKISKLERNKEIDLGCSTCDSLRIKNEKLKEENFKLSQFEKSTHALKDMLSNQKPSGDKLGLGFKSGEASSSGIKQICLGIDLEPDEWIKDSGCSKYMTGNRNLFSTYRAYNGGNVTFSSNLRGNIIGKGQICDNKCKVIFFEFDSKIIKDGLVIGKEELVRNLPKLKFDYHFCDACKIRRQAHASHKPKNLVSTSKCLELLHMDLFGPTAVRSYGGNFYTIVIVDDYSRYTWTRFLTTKTESFEQFEIFSKKVQNQLECPIVSIRMDHGQEFDNEAQFGAFCDTNGITHNLYAPRTPQSNGLVERKNRTIQEMSRTMLNEQSFPQKFWCNAVDTSTYILNRILIRPFLEKTSYEILKVKRPSIEYFKVFRSKCFILNTKEYLTKFDPKSYEGIFLAYSQNNKAYVVLNRSTGIIKESLNVTFDESPPPSKASPLVDDDLDKEEADRITEKKNLENVIDDKTSKGNYIVNVKETRSRPLDNVIGNLNQ
ncbi:retrovirus-related pol polyprotein from transposon TNT 1-94 [Tanacetum coccineum]